MKRILTLIAAAVVAVACGNALARLLAGDENFSARMPYTYPRHSAALTTYDFRVSEQTGTMEGVYDYNAQVDVQWPFGFGLSYTTFDYSKPTVTVAKDGTVTAKVIVTNTGKVAGKEAVGLYVSAPAGGLEKPAKELKAFAKTRLLAPGESQTLTFSVKAYDLASFNEQANRWETAAGTYTFGFGRNVRDIPVSFQAVIKNASTFAVSK